MATVTGEYIITNKLKGCIDSSGYSPRSLNYGGNRVYRAYYNSSIVWDALKTTLTASNFTIGSKGGKVSDYVDVDSYGVDVDNNITNFTYSCSPNEIPTRLETTSTTHTIAITQSGTGNQITVTATQAGAVYTVTSTATASIVAAKGGNSTITVSWTLYKDGELYKTGTSTPTAITGNDVAGDNITCTIDGVQVKVPSAQDVTYSSARTVFNVKTWTFVADGKTFSGSGTVPVKQSANSYTDVWNTPILTVAANVTQINSSENPISFNVSSYKTGIRTYTSTYELPIEADVSATISATLGSLSTTSISGKNKYFILTIDANPTNTSRTSTVTVNSSSNRKDIIITQNARTHTSTSYGTPSVTSTAIGGTIPASGGTVWLTVSWSQIRTYHYDNGTTSSSTITGSSTATVKGGVSGGGSINGGGIYAGSLGTTVTAAKTVYTITSYSYTANGVTATASGSIVVNQAENKITNTSYGSYNLSISANSTANIANTGTTRTIYVTCTQNYTNKYSSGSTANGTVNATATVSTSSGALSTTSITGSGNSTLTVGRNIGSSYTITVTATVGSVTKSISFVQNAAVYVFTADSASLAVAYNETSVTLYGTSTLNGSANPIPNGYITLGSGLSLSSNQNYDSGRFAITVTFAQNYSSSSKTYTVTVKQPHSNSVITYTITQAGKPAPTLVFGAGSFSIRAGKLVVNGSILFKSSASNSTISITVEVDGNSVGTISVSLTSTTASDYDSSYYEQSFSKTFSTEASTDSSVVLTTRYGSESSISTQLDPA